MQAATSSSSGPMTATEILADLIVRQVGFWQRKSAESPEYATNLVALHHAIKMNGFRMCEIDNIVALGLRDPGTVEQMRANHHGLDADQQHFENVAITQLGIAQIIRDYIGTNYGKHEEITLYVCDRFFRESNKSILEELDFTMIGRDGLPRYINQNTLVYAMNMDSRELQMAVDFSWHQNALPPAAVITQIMTGTLDVELFDKYWLAPLLELSLESSPALTALPERSEVMGSGPSSQPPSDYDDWVDLRESYSQQVLQRYSEEADAYNIAMKAYQEYVAHMSSGGLQHIKQVPTPRPSWISDPMMIMLYRKDSPTRPVTEPDRQPQDLLFQQQQQEYQQGEESEYI